MIELFNLIMLVIALFLLIKWGLRAIVYLLMFYMLLIVVAVLI